MTDPNNPDGLSDARALIERDFERAVAAGERCGNSVIRLMLPVHLLAPIREALFTPPASDAAVSAGEVCDQCNGHGFLVMAPSTCSAGGERMACPKCQGGTPIESKDGSWSGKVNISTDAAPKVASDTGAGLRLDFDKVLDKVSSILSDDPVCNGRVSTASIARIAALVIQAENHALATPTDATDGATGGNASEKPTSCATTPGGDLLEQAARVAENPGFVEARDTEWDAGFNYAKRYIAAAIRALNTAGKGEGGE